VIKHFCDRCGRDITDAIQNQIVVNFIKSETTLRNAKPNRNETIKMELCSGCESELRFFLRGEDKNVKDHRN
jgi:hypothetical protein